MSKSKKIKIAITGAKGFIGSNLLAHLSERSDVELTALDVEDPKSELFQAIEEADIVYHLAGVNRPEDPREFEAGNRGFTAEIVSNLRKRSKPPVLAATSSIQASKDNPYGNSKRAAEQEIFAYAEELSAPVHVYRLPNVFGKWSRPYYNSAVATFCHQVANGEEPSVNDSSAPLHLVYIDDVVASLMGIIDGEKPITEDRFCKVTPEYETTVGEVAWIISGFPAIQSGAKLPDLSDGLIKSLYSTYLAYLPVEAVSYAVDTKSDGRGYLFELVKSVHSGQVFVSRTKRGITRGNHYHHTKVEKFCVVEGSARINLRHLISDELISINVSGTDCRIVDIPPGYTHNITNTGKSDLITIFWANEIFDPSNPDTFYREV
jgi:UDP-2-acetamido-2,6-beta-L-arabino-hexul-4-ose reductase